MHERCAWMDKAAASLRSMHELGSKVVAMRRHADAFRLLAPTTISLRDPAVFEVWSVQSNAIYTRVTNPS